MNSPRVAILAGGLGTRLRALTGGLPKSLVDVDGEPFVLRQLSLLARRGIREAVLCVGYGEELLRARVGDGAGTGVKVLYSSDGGSPLGTGGAILNAFPLLSDPFWVLYGDSYLDTDYAPALERFRRGDGLALMTVIRNEGRWGEPNAAFDGTRVLRYGKQGPRDGMTHLDYGLLLMSKAAFKDAPARGPFDLAGVLGDLALRGGLLGLEMREPLHEAGSPEGLAALRRHLGEARG